MRKWSAGVAFTPGADAPSVPLASRRPPTQTPKYTARRWYCCFSLRTAEAICLPDGDAARTGCAAAKDTRTAVAASSAEALRLSSTGAAS